MERLTNKREADAQRKEYERRIANGYPRNIPEERFLRLAAYEDTGLSPQACAEAGKAEETLSGCNYSISRMVELMKSDVEGRVLILPCKVGDMLYEVTGRKTISVYKVKAIRVELFSLFIEWDIVEGFVWQYLNGINDNEIGKTVFLTREEAEKAMKGETEK